MEKTREKTSSAQVKIEFRWKDAGKLQWLKLSRISSKREIERLVAVIWFSVFETEIFEGKRGKIFSKVPMGFELRRQTLWKNSTAIKAAKISRNSKHLLNAMTFFHIVLKMQFWYRTQVKFSLTLILHVKIKQLENQATPVSPWTSTWPGFKLALYGCCPTKHLWKKNVSGETQMKSLWFSNSRRKKTIKIELHWKWNEAIIFFSAVFLSTECRNQCWMAKSLIAVKNIFGEKISAPSSCFWSFCGLWYNQNLKVKKKWKGLYLLNKKRFMSPSKS